MTTTTEDRKRTSLRTVSRASDTSKKTEKKPRQTKAKKTRPSGTTDRRTPKVDPRIKARRAAVERAEARRRRNQLLGVFAVVALIGGVWWLLRSPVLDVDQVRVRPAERTSTSEILDVAGVERGQQMMDLDPARIERGIEQLPWVEDATVTRDWPGVVRISVAERRPVATISTGEGRWFVADIEGRLVDAVSERDTNLLLLDGIVEGGFIGGQLDDRFVEPLHLTLRLSATMRDELAAMHYVRSSDLQFDLRRGGIVEFGDLSEVEDKLVALETMLVKVDGDCVDYLDVRAPSTPVLKRRADCG